MTLLPGRADHQRLEIKWNIKKEPRVPANDVWGVSGGGSASFACQSSASRTFWITATGIELPGYPLRHAAVVRSGSLTRERRRVPRRETPAVWPHLQGVGEDTRPALPALLPPR